MTFVLIVLVFGELPRSMLTSGSDVTGLTATAEAVVALRDLPPIPKVIVTPDSHRQHHGS